MFGEILRNIYNSFLLPPNSWLGTLARHWLCQGRKLPHAAVTRMPSPTLGSFGISLGPGALPSDSMPAPSSITLQQTPCQPACDHAGPSAWCPPSPTTPEGHFALRTQPRVSHAGSGHEDRTWGQQVLHLWAHGHPGRFHPAQLVFQMSQFQPPFLQLGPSCPPPDFSPLLMELGRAMSGPAGAAVSLKSYNGKRQRWHPVPFRSCALSQAPAHFTH